MNRRFIFHSEYDLPGPPARVFDALRDVDTWQRWWPQIREIERYDERRGRVLIRSFLPLSLDLILTESVVDQSDRRLRADIAGDLVGWSQFHVKPGNDGGTRLIFDQVSVVTKRGAATAAPFFRMAFVANHRVMMSSGMRRLARHTA
ncbi:polyketide cyclase [Calidifontibacter sp. DB0510]|uniref:Polyketide cyclase n=1 Tax=Metallococcus carri TaxID=1656884 RepID=A0A967B1S4_9MICO|nr:SRPBCC family protein [Metallococcus carri]NHN57231.1 polyketide cyclase [Metallococcus carri]NOP37966.1 polyketide cyclase [Calidifontibacter sp. DB2511S]